LNKYTDPDYKNSALIIIDAQNDFTLIDAPVKIEGTFELIPIYQKIINIFRNKNRPIIHIVRLYKKDGSNVDICRKEKIENGYQIVIPGSKGSEIIDELKPYADLKLNNKLLLKNKFQKISNNEWIMYKSRWGAFYNTKLDRFLKRLKINTLIIIGCNFPNCPRATIYEASERDYKIVVIKVQTENIYFEFNVFIFLIKFLIILGTPPRYTGKTRPIISASV